MFIYKLLLVLSSYVSKYITRLYTTYILHSTLRYSSVNLLTTSLLLLLLLLLLFHHLHYPSQQLYPTLRLYNPPPRWTDGWMDGEAGGGDKMPGFS